MYLCNCHTPLQTGLKITNRQHTRHSLFFNYQSPFVYTYLVFLTYHLPLQQEIRLAVHSRSNLIGVTYIHLSLSLTHSLTHSPVHNIPDAPTKRYFFLQKITQSLWRIVQVVFTLPENRWHFDVIWFKPNKVRRIKFDVWINRCTFDNLGRSKVELSSAHEKFGVWTGPKVPFRFRINYMYFNNHWL